MRRRRRRSSGRLSAKRASQIRRRIIVCAAALLFLALLWGGLRVYRAQAAYNDASEHIEALRTIANADVSSMTAADMARTEGQITELRQDLAEIERTTSMPFGTGSLFAHTPWIGPRYEAARDTLSLGLVLADAGMSGTRIGRETLFAFEQSGINADASNASQTWIDVLARNQADIQRITEQLDQAQRIRSEINPDLLPDGARSRLDTFDRAIARFDGDRFSGTALDALLAGLGSDGEARYLVLFQNPAELRPSGGFPGTIALVTIERGQLRSYEFSDVHLLTEDYIAQRDENVPQPWPIQQYFPQDGFLLQDATWFADFPRSGEQVMQMYAETNWPPIDGVITVDPAAVSRLLTVTGPLTIEVDGEDRLVTSENVYDEIDRQRRIRRAGDETATAHKEVLALIGERVIEQLKNADRDTLTQAVMRLSDAAGQRDIQFYAQDPAVQESLERRGWTGRIIPDADVPTLAVTLANVAINKASLAMQPAMALTIEPAEDGRRTVTMELDLEHTGSNDADPLYEGFQRWWIEVTLPEGSTLLTTHPDRLPDPEPSNGGSYLIEIFPQQVGNVSITFSMPEDDELLLRRQPGVRPVEFSVLDAGCDGSTRGTLDGDVTVNLAELCEQSGP